LISVGDPRHPEHERWKSDREVDRQFYLRPENERRRVRTHKPGRELMFEPTWVVFTFLGKPLGPHDPYHPQHEIWRQWQFDIAMDSPHDKRRRKEVEDARKASGYVSSGDPAAKEAQQTAFSKLSPEQQLYWSELLPHTFGECELSSEAIDLMQQRAIKLCTPAPQRRRSSLWEWLKFW
jgi:hypothetical protein